MWFNYLWKLLLYFSSIIQYHHIKSLTKSIVNWFIVEKGLCNRRYYHHSWDPLHISHWVIFLLTKTTDTCSKEELKAGSGLTNCLEGAHDNGMKWAYLQPLWLRHLTSLLMKHSKEKQADEWSHEMGHTRHFLHLSINCLAKWCVRLSDYSYTALQLAAAATPINISENVSPTLSYREHYHEDLPHS